MTEAGEQYTGLWRKGSSNRLKAAEEAERIAAAAKRRRRPRRVGRAEADRRAVAAPLRPHDAAARGEPALRLHRRPHAAGGPGELRPAQGPDLPAHQLAVPVDRHVPEPAVDRLARRPRRSGLRRRRRATSRASTCCRATASSTTPGSPTTTRSSRPTTSTTCRGCRATSAASTTSSPSASWPSSTRRRASSRRRSPPIAGGESFRSQGKVLIDAGWRAVYGETGIETREGKDDEDGEQALPQLARGAARPLPRGRGAGQADAAAGALHGVVAAARDGDRGQARRGRRGRRGDEGVGPRHAGHARRDDRAPARQGVPAPRGQGAARDRQGPRPSSACSATTSSPGPTSRAAGRSGCSRWSTARTNRGAFMRDIRRFTTETVAWFSDKDRTAMRVERREIGPCPRCDGTIVERPKSYSCTSWKSAEEPGCGFTIWKQHGRAHDQPRGGGGARRRQGKDSADAATPSASSSAPARRRAAAARSWSAARASAARRGRAARSRAAAT